MMWAVIRISITGGDEMLRCAGLTLGRPNESSVTAPSELPDRLLTLFPCSSS